MKTRVALLSTLIAPLAACSHDETIVAQDLVVRWADVLHSQVNPDGTYQHASSELAAKDPWGNPLKVSYAKNETGESLTVVSAGLDGVFDNADDIAQIRKRP